AALDRCRQARAACLPIYVETRPLYLHLTRSRFTEPDAAKYVGAPPLREQADRDALWRGLAAGDIDTLCSDHAPWTLDAKLDPAPGRRRPGAPDADAVLRGCRDRADHPGPVRGADLGPRGPAVRSVPPQGHHRGRLRRRPHALGSRRAAGDQRGRHGLTGGILRLPRLGSHLLAAVRPPPRPAGTGRRPVHRPARPGPVDSPPPRAGAGRAALTGERGQAPAA